jgi:two-component system chemotaxis sensor kinase CheA
VTDEIQQPDPSDSGSSPLPDDMKEYLQVFLDESEEELDAIVAALLTLENDPRDADSLNEAFRLLHTLKGSSGMMGFDNISELAHELEDRFETFRTGGQLLDQATMNVLLEAVDFFRGFNSGLRRGELLNIDGRHLIARLTELDQQAASRTTPESLHSQAESDLADRSAQTLAMAGAYRVKVCFEKGLQLADLKARLIVARLSKIGEIVATDPPIDDVQSIDELPQFALIMMTDQPSSEVHRIADVDGVDTVEIEGGSLVDAPQGDSASRGESPFAAPAKAAAESLVAEAPAAEPKPADDRSTSSSASAADEQPEPTVDPSESTDPPTASTDPPSAAEPESAQSGENTRSTVSETVRVDIDRLDRLMNLTGELIVTRARFTQIASDMRPVFRNHRISNRNRDLVERLRLQFRKLQQLSELENHDFGSWQPLLKELEDGLTGLEEQSAVWEEAQQYFTRISEAVDQLNRVSDNLQTGVLETRMVQVAPLFNRFRRVIRDLSSVRNKRVQLAIHGEKTELDKRMIDELGDPLIHLVRNSIDHGIESSAERRQLGKSETGTIHLEASHSGNNVFISVRDDGAGINVDRIRERLLERGLVTAADVDGLTEQQIIDFIWHPGFSTAEKVTDISGRGVGMDVVRNRIMHLNGTIDVESRPGEGTTFTIRLPLTLAIIRSLLVQFRDGVFSIPIDDVREIVSVPQNEVYSVHGHRTIDVRGEFIPLAGMGDVFEWNTIEETTRTAADPSSRAAINVVILKNGDQTFGLCVDELLGGADIVIKSLADNFSSIRGLSGASVMGDGSVCLMLDINTLTEMVAEQSRPQGTADTIPV